MPVPEPTWCAQLLALRNHPDACPESIQYLDYALFVCDCGDGRSGGGPNTPPPPPGGS